MLLLRNVALVAVVGLTIACPGGPAEGEGEGEGGEGEGDGGGGEGEGEGEGDPLPDGTCATQADCVDDGGVCTSPDAPPACGIPPPDFADACAQNGDCAASVGTVCDLVDDGCGGSHLDCVAACGADPSCVPGAQCDCAAGEVCNFGRCEAIPCAGGAFTCPFHLACGGVAPDPLGDDRDHGCVPISCTRDDECPFGAFIPDALVVVLGFCVNGTCASGPGVCALPVP